MFRQSTFEALKEIGLKLSLANQRIGDLAEHNARLLEACEMALAYHRDNSAPDPEEHLIVAIKRMKQD